MRYPTHRAAMWVIALGMLLPGCDAPDQTPHRTQPTTATTPDTTPTATVTIRGCVVSPRGQADRDCDPGATNPDVTQATIDTTICVPGWTATVRPPTSYTSPLRNAEMLTYYPPDVPPTAVRYDHLLPLELGGHPRDTANIWPQPVEASYVKNAHGGRLKDRVCRGELTLGAAQHEILTAWTH